MHNTVEVFIYLDIFVFISLIAFFIIVFKSSSLFRNKKSKESFK